MKRSILGLVGLASLLACGSSGSTTSNLVEETGEVGMSITVPIAKGHKQSNSFSPEMLIPGGETLNTVSYNMTDGTHTYSGTADITNSVGTANFIVAPVAASTGYTVTITGNTVDTLVTCAGTSGAFNVINRQSTTVNLNLYCTSSNAGDGGAVDVNGSLNDCPFWQYVVALSTNIPRAGNTTLQANAVAPGTTPITFTWSVSGGGVLSGQTNPDNNDSSIVFTCPNAAAIPVVTLVVSDATSTGCPALDTTDTINITCN